MLRIPMTDQDKAELSLLNKKIIRAFLEREAWLDAKITEYATLSVGGTLYDLETGGVAGHVRQIFRQGHNLKDTLMRNLVVDSIHVEYCYEPEDGGWFSTLRNRNVGDIEDRDRSLGQQLLGTLQRIKKTKEEASKQPTTPQ